MPHIGTVPTWIRNPPLPLNSVLRDQAPPHWSAFPDRLDAFPLMLPQRGKNSRLHVQLLLPAGLGSLPSSIASIISRAVRGFSARLSTSMAALYRVPRLNQGLPVFRRLGAIRLMGSPTAAS
jgi:hypothetical protein